MLSQRQGIAVLPPATAAATSLNTVKLDQADAGRVIFATQDGGPVALNQRGQDGGLAIVDYKSGAVTRPVRWLAARPAGVQLCVYAHGLDVLDSGDIRVLAYAQLKAGEIGTTGLMATEGLFPGLEVPGAGRSRVVS